MARPMTESNQKKRRSEYVSPVQWQKYLTFTLLCCINWTGKAFVNQGGPIVHFRSSEASPPFVLHAKTAGKKTNKGKKKKSPNDRYSSISLTQAEVAKHVHQMYSEGAPYKKTSAKIRKAAADRSNDDSNQEGTIPENELVKRLNQYPALILNADFQPMSYLPLSVCHWQEAIKSVFSGKVTVVDVYEDVQIRAANLEIPLPSVIALNEYVPQCHHTPAFTRRNVFLRDEYRCQYCNNAFHTRDLSIDHVVPRSMGGRLTWDNAATSCLKCNGRKGNLLVRDLKQVGMKLQKEPRAPSRRELAAKAGKMLPRKVHPTWQPYLGFDTEEQQSRQSNKEEATSTKESSKTKQPEKEKELQNIRSR